MNSRTQISPSGDVAIPKDVRERLAWRAGTPLELIETADGITLRRRPVSRAFPAKSLADLHALPPAAPAQPIEAISRLSDDDLRRLIR
ncbi:MAG: AbrB/MazE/SpoVT family DNA-binding domain-containing protein [Sphingomonas sp.]|uniref:AbrB/MazE/SpoVT family DNA-binding domain-containing protein n=1 Tax=Sphingomonas sp. TaxID=28214 RepID=UPI0025E1E30F|nr:AbrB/MazE/SpoVT family DNA-binding domain-containing protein [Sphingomonas sp.]MBQ1497368.1 AbrB/MazE/SpoVT family DNA-binding domain-containing protein [Sphingomonas sp.]